MVKGLTSECNGTTILTDRGRNCNIDLIRIIACFAVVGLHTFPKDLSVFTATLYYLCGYAIPFFFMSSGYFLLNRGNVTWRYSLHKIFGVIRTVILWNVIVVIAKLTQQFLFEHQTSINLLIIPLECIKSLVQKGTMWQFWYMGASLILYIMLPIISRLNKKQKRVLLIITGIVAIAFEICSIAMGFPVQAKVIQTFRIWTWLFYFVLGSEMNNIKNILKDKVSLGLHIFIAACATIIVLVYQNYAGVQLIIPEIGTRLHAEYFYDSVLEMIWVIWLFSLLLRLNIRGKVQIIIELFASLTMGIYIIHPLLLRLIVRIIERNSLSSSVVCWLIALLGSALIIWVIYKTPLKKYLLKV